MRSKAGLGIAALRERGPREARGEAVEAAVSHTVTTEVAVSFLGTGNVTYFLVTGMQLQHLDTKAGEGREEKVGALTCCTAVSPPPLPPSAGPSVLWRPAGGHPRQPSSTASC